VTTGDSPGRELYSEFIKDQLDEEQERKKSFEQRGVTVITTSGALVTLLFGLTALSVKGESTFEIPTLSATFLTVGLVFFVVAAVLALLTNIPRSYESVTVDSLWRAVADRWGDTEATASAMVAKTRLKEIRTAKTINREKGYLLSASMVCEILAVALVAAAMAKIVWSY
jgi:hypothetical protein